MAILVILFALTLALVAPFYIMYKPPNVLIRYFQYRWPQVLFQIDTREKVLALTIDDAPTQYTHEILSLLSKYNATATFFVIGSQVDSPERKEILKDIVLQGSELGNHAMFDEPSRDLSSEILSSQIRRVDKIIDEVYVEVGRQRNSRFFRPGSGFFSQKMIDLLSDLEYRLVLGGIYPHDPQIPYWRINARHILSMVRPGGIIICHDRRAWTIPMLQRVLPELQVRGYKVVTVNELIQSANP